MHWSRACWTWVLMALAETVHGIARRLWLQPQVGEALANRIGLVLGSLIVLAIAVACHRWIGTRNARQRLAVGSLWVALMFGFEAALTLAQGLPLSRLLADYDPSRGGFMALGMAVLWLSPLLAARLRGDARPAP